MAKIVILGAGLAGLTAAETLVGKLGAEHQITVVAPNGKFTFFPALVPFVFGKFKQEDIRFDLHEKLSRHGIRFVQAEAIEINPYYKEVTITGEDMKGLISYDYLIVTTGRRLATEKVPGFFEHAHHLLGIDAAINFQRAIDNFREGAIVVGMCPNARLPVPVLETALALSKKFEKQIADEAVAIHAVFPKALREVFGDALLFTGIEAEFEKHGIKLVTDFPIANITDTQILTQDSKALNYNLLMLVPPFRGQAMLRALGKAADQADFAVVDPHLQIEGLKHHYAAGDITAFPGPKFGYLAIRQGEVAAENVIAEVMGQQPHSVYMHEFSPIYRPKEKELSFMHYGIWDNDLYSPVEGTVLSWANEVREKYERTAA